MKTYGVVDVWIHLLLISFLMSHMQHSVLQNILKVIYFKVYLCLVFECIRKQDMQHSAQQERIQPTNSNTHAHRGNSYIDNIKNNRREQFPCSVIVTPDDDHIGQNL
jgi:hypothetical protein